MDPRRRNCRSAGMPVEMMLMVEQQQGSCEHWVGVGEFGTVLLMKEEPWIHDDESVMLAAGRIARLRESSNGPSARATNIPSRRPKDSVNIYKLLIEIVPNSPRVWNTNHKAKRWELRNR